MDALTALLTRHSAAKLCAPAPQGAQREQLFRAALRAPDHGRLRPWHFLVVEGAARERLGAAMASAMQRHDPSLAPEAAAKLRANPLRAPLVLVLLARIAPAARVPAAEQRLAVACAAANMLVAAHAMGFGAIWRTGAVTGLAELHAELGLAPNEEVLGFLYLGTVDGPVTAAAPPEVAAHFRAWPAPAAGGGA